MMDPSSRLELGEAPQALVYRDHADPARFYATRKAPRIAPDETGAPQIDLLLYGRRVGSDLQLLGGQVNLTTDLALAPREQETLSSALSHLLAREAQAGRLPQPQPPTLVSPEWLAGQVEVQLGGGIVLTGCPSLVGGNTCALSTSLDAGQASSLRKLFQDGLKDGVIAYRTEVSAVKTADTSVRESTEQRQGAAHRMTRDAELHIRRATAVRYPLEFRGPVDIPAGELSRRMQISAL